MFKDKDHVWQSGGRRLSEDFYSLLHNIFWSLWLIQPFKPYRINFCTPQHSELEMRLVWLTGVPGQDIVANCCLLRFTSTNLSNYLTNNAACYEIQSFFSFGEQNPNIILLLLCTHVIKFNPSHEEDQCHNIQPCSKIKEWYKTVNCSHCSLLLLCFYSFQWTLPWLFPVQFSLNQPTLVLCTALNTFGWWCYWIFLKHYI